MREGRNLLGGILQNWKFERAKSLCRAGQFVRSRDIVESLLERFPQSAALSTFRADLLLFDQKHEDAKVADIEARKTLEANMPIGLANRQYIDAYIIFSKEALSCFEAGEEFVGWEELVDSLSEIGASKSVKRLLPLP